MRAALPAALAALALAAARPAAATPLEAFIDVEDQADLEDLLAAGDLTRDTYDELLELLEAGVDLETADRARLYALPNLTYGDVDRILAYRDRHGGAIGDPAALVAAGALSADQLRAISPFLLASPDRTARGVRGWVRGTARFAVRDRLLPPLALRGRLVTAGHIRAGLAASFTRLEIGAPVFDPNRRALLAERRGYGGALPKAYLAYDGDDTAAIAGTFRAGFGQRLVFDNSNTYTPDGLYPDDALTYAPDLSRECRESAGELATSCADDPTDRFVTPDFRPRGGLVGAGAGWKRLPLGAGWLQAYAWASSARRSIYQYELVDRARCEDPHADGDPGCAAPTVYVRPDGPLLSPTTRFAFETLPDVFEERLAGAHVTYFADRRNAVGLTAYGAALRDLVDGIDLDTQEHARMPTGRRYGALGASFAFGRGWLDLAGEAALSVDRLPDDPASPQEGGGGAAAIVRATATRPRQELEASFRYYGIDYANPYARPISQDDELDGARARDEAGARLRLAHAGARLAVRALVDLWYPISSLDAGSPRGFQPKLDSYLRVDARAGRALALGLWLRYQDRDLRAAGTAECFEGSFGVDEAGEPSSCDGRRLTSIARARLGAGGALDVTALLEHRLLDDGAAASSPFRDKLRQDVAGWLIALWRPDGKLRVRARARYLHEAANDGADDRGERSLAALLDAALGLGDRDLLRARLDAKRLLDRRDATLARSPNPELQVWLSYEARL